MLLPRATGTGRRAEVGELALVSIGRFCRNIPAAVVDIEMMGPPDIEQRVGVAWWAYFPGRVFVRTYVGPALGRVHADVGFFPLRRLHASVPQRYRD